MENEPVLLVKVLPGMKAIQDAVNNSVIFLTDLEKQGVVELNDEQQEYINDQFKLMGESIEQVYGDTEN